VLQLSPCKPFCHPVCYNITTAPISHPIIDMFSTIPEQDKSHLCFYISFYLHLVPSIIHYGSCLAAWSSSFVMHCFLLSQVHSYAALPIFHFTSLHAFACIPMISRTTRMQWCFLMHHCIPLFYIIHIELRRAAAHNCIGAIFYTDICHLIFSRNVDQTYKLNLVLEVLHKVFV
jgi:hypothetical protein